MLILQVVVPLPHATFLTAVAPSRPSEDVNVQEPSLPPRVSSTVPSPISERFVSSNVDATSAIMLLEIAPAVLPLALLAITNTSPSLSVEASVTNSQPALLLPSPAVANTA